MRDGLGMELERIRYTAGDETGFDWYRGDLLIAEQPTQRGAPDRCTDWTDFAERLEWVLCTMPGYAIVTLIAPAVKGLSAASEAAISFIQDAGKLVALTIAMNGPDLEDLDWQLRASGWQERDNMGNGFSEWSYGPFPTGWGYNRHLASTASLTAATFRRVFGVVSPQELAVKLDRDIVVSGNQAHFGRISRRYAYIGRELGIPIQAYEQ